MRIRLFGVSVKKYLPRTLFARSLLILVTPIILIQVFSTFMFFDRHWNRMADRLAFAVAGELALIADRVESHAGKEEFIKPMIQYAGQYLQLLISYEPEAVLEKVYQSRSGFGKVYMIEDTLARALESQVRRPFSITVDGEEKWVQLSLQLDSGVLHVSLPERRLFSSSSYIYILWMIGSSVLLLIVAILFMRNQIRPIRRLAVAAERIGRGQDIPSSFKPEGATEVRQAAQSFIDMHRRVKRQIEQRMTMLAGISHDLRTPLTRIKLQLAMMKQDDDVKAIHSDLVEMERMINAYLDFARGEKDEVPARQNMREILMPIIDKLHRAHDVEIQTGFDSEETILVRAESMRRCFDNLLSNSIRHGASQIKVSVTADEKYLYVDVDDNGPGIPESKREDVFKPFYRIEESRNTATGGVGLGMSIAQDAVHKHGGKIILEDSALGGLKVKINLPL